jgi:hypothetical protein
MTTAGEDRTVCLRLTRAEALVLFEWLARVDAARNRPAEDPVLWRLEGQLERTLVEPLAPNYKQAVEAARREVRSLPTVAAKGASARATVEELVAQTNKTPGTVAAMGDAEGLAPNESDACGKPRRTRSASSLSKRSPRERAPDRAAHRRRAAAGGNHHRQRRRAARRALSHAC